MIVSLFFFRIDQLMSAGASGTAERRLRSPPTGHTLGFALLIRTLPEELSFYD